MRTRCRVVVVAMAILLGFLGREAGAQVVVEPQQVTEPTKLVLAACQAAAGKTLDDLDQVFNSGNWAATRSLAECMVNAAKITNPPGKPVTFVVWIGSSPMGQLVLRRLLIRSDASTPFSNDLPGVGAGQPLLVVFLSRHEKGVLAEAYASVEEADPVLEKIPDVIARVLPVFYAALIDGLPLRVPPGTVQLAAKAATDVWATAYAVPLPVQRSTITVNSVAAEPAAVDDLLTQTDRLATALNAQLSMCGSLLARDHAATLRALLTGRAPTPACFADASGEACFAALHQGLRQSFEDRRSQGCSSDEQVKAMTAVDTAFRKALPEMYGRQVKADIVVKNAPLTHVSFGLVEAVLFLADVGWNQGPRVTLKDGVYESDPLPRTLTMVTVNWSRAGYNPKAVTPTGSERWRWFGGAVIVPDFGIGGGASYMPVRGVTLNVGLAVLVTKGSEGRAIGQAPADANRPYGLDHPLVFFAGVGYHFK